MGSIVTAYDEFQDLPFKKFFESISSAMAPTMKIQDSINRATSPTMEFFKGLNSIYSSTYLSHISAALTDTISPLVDNHQLHTTMLSNMTFLSSSLAEMLNSLSFKQNALYSIKYFQTGLTEFAKSFDFSAYESVLLQITKQLEENGIDGDYDVDEEQQAEFMADLAIVADDHNEHNWYERVNFTVRKWFEKNYALALLLFSIIPALISFYSILQVKPQRATVRELPSVKAEVVISIEQHQIVSVVDSQRNWVKVIYLNPDDLGIYEGWLSKRSCTERELEEPEEQDELEESEVNEEHSESLNTDSNGDIEDLDISEGE